MQAIPQVRCRSAEMSRAQREMRLEDGTIHRSIVVGTAGHIDHGKTTLVYALTGTDTDRLPEEKRRGMTINLGFACLRLPDGNRGMLDLSIVDVPGHRAFVRNMLAGAGGIDCVMLVIAADEGVMPQTEEHLTICSLLGICRGLVVLTKADAVSSERMQQVSGEVRSFLRHTFLEDAPTLRVSARTGEGIAALKKALAALACEIPERSSESVPRLPLDRAFSVRGFGTVVTGTLQSGEIREGDMLIQHPGGRAVRVRGVQVHHAARRSVQAACRVALNLTGVEVNEIQRGDMLTPPRTLAAVSVLDVLLRPLPGTKFLHRSKVRLHAFASESLATILLYEHGEKAADGEVLARLRLQSPLLLLPGDRFVVRQCTPAKTAGGGVVLDASPLPCVKKSIVHGFLQQLRLADLQEQMRLRILRRDAKGVCLADLVGETGLAAEVIARHLALLVASGRAARVGHFGSPGERFVSAETVRSLENQILGELERTAGGRAARAELAARLRMDAELSDIVLRGLSETGKVTIADGAVAIPGRAAPLDDRMAAAIAAVEAMYVQSGLASPLAAEVAQRSGLQAGIVREIITQLLRSKRLVRMGSDDAFTHVSALKALYAKLRTHRGERFDVARFKAFTGLTRKHAIPLLEHLDQVWLTRNSGGVRIVI